MGFFSSRTEVKKYRIVAGIKVPTPNLVFVVVVVVVVVAVVFCCCFFVRLFFVGPPCNCPPC